MQNFKQCIKIKLKQVNNFKGLVDKDDIKSDTDLFLISIGGNDANGLIGAGMLFLFCFWFCFSSLSSLLNPTKDDGFIEKLGNVIDHGHEVIDAIVEGVKTLHGYGARHFVLVNVPPALITPRALEQLGRSVSFYLFVSLFSFFLKKIENNIAKQSTLLLYL